MVLQGRKEGWSRKTNNNKDCKFLSILFDPCSSSWDDSTHSYFRFRKWYKSQIKQLQRGINIEIHKSMTNRGLDWCQRNLHLIVNFKLTPNWLNKIFKLSKNDLSIFRKSRVVSIKIFNTCKPFKVILSYLTNVSVKGSGVESQWFVFLNS